MTDRPARPPAADQARVDVHHHILPPTYVAALGPERIGAPASSGRMPVWTPAHSIEAMDSVGIATAITSVSAPGFAIDDASRRTTLVREANEFAARMKIDHPGRFGSFASLPLPDIDASLAEIAYAFDVLGAEGICLMTHHAGVYPGDPALEPVMAELDRRSAVVFVHPTSPMCAACVAGLSDSTLEFPFDTTRAIASLVLNGVTVRHPRIRFIFSHAGGTIPFLAARLDTLGGNRPEVRERLPEGVLHALRTLYFDTALSTNRHAFASLLELTPREQILLGTDFPFAPLARLQSTVAALDGLGLDPATVQGIGGGNARALLARRAG
jgi:predicted TIM-barrel fold metal-dependent hydrolase